jgi:hypothetical protein
MSITAIVENDTIKLPVHVRNGTRVEIILPAEVSAQPIARTTFAERYAKYQGIADALPEDFAENHDHYLHGAPKLAAKMAALQ